MRSAPIAQVVQLQHSLNLEAMERDIYSTRLNVIRVAEKLDSVVVAA